MNGYEFEEYCQKLFSTIYHCQVDHTPLSGDVGKDLVMIRGRRITYIECKHWRHTVVGRPVVQKLHSAMITGPADAGIIVTTGRFTQSAKDYVFAYNLEITFVD